MVPGLSSPPLHTLRCIDLSVPISPATAEPQPPVVDYVNHQRAAKELAAIATALVPPSAQAALSMHPITPDSFRDGLGLANENLQLDSHAGTHLDAPWHFGPTSAGRPAKTIDQIPLDWCFRPAVVLELRHKKAGDLISIEDLSRAFEEIAYRPQPLDIVLLMTGADKRFRSPDYFSAHPGMSRESTLWLVDQGIKIIGTDGWGFDRPAGAMLADYLKEGDSAALLPAHMAGRDREYCHIEKLANLEQLPRSGFWLACFPIKIEHASAGWVRAVAFVTES